MFSDNTVVDFAQDHAELGAALNGFSLNESDQLSAAIERAGQAVDATYMSTTRLVCHLFVYIHGQSDAIYMPKLQELEQNWAEPLSEYTQFASIIKKLLAYRHQKHVQYEMTQDTLESKREQLDELEKSEREARRLEEALGRGRGDVPGSPGADTQNQSPETPQEPADDAEESEPQRLAQEQSAYLPPHPGPSPVRRRAPGMGFISALTYTLHGMMDVDPETARRSSISKTRETISQVSGMLPAMEPADNVGSSRMPYICQHKT